MRWIRYSHGGRTSHGILEGDSIDEVTGNIFSDYRRTGTRVALKDVTIEIPVIPPTFYCAGKNYVAHVIKSAAARGDKPKVPEKPDIGYRANNALVAHDQPVILPPDVTELVHYEGELVVVIGKKVKHVSEADALKCVFGYTIGNDLSERTWQRGDRTFWRGKNTDTFKPMGPWIETDVDLDAMETAVRVNGKETIRFDTNNMLFGVAAYIAMMTRYLTLYPGDVIWMGTEGVSPNLKAGDMVEIDITGIGTLRNPLIAGQV